MIIGILEVELAYGDDLGQYWTTNDDERVRDMAILGFLVIVGPVVAALLLAIALVWGALSYFRMRRGGASVSEARGIFFRNLGRGAIAMFFIPFVLPPLYAIYLLIANYFRSVS